MWEGENIRKGLGEKVKKILDCRLDHHQETINSLHLKTQVWNDRDDHLGILS